MAENVKISSDYEEYEAETQQAAQEAGKAEKMVMGVPMPVGTIGKASILAFEAGKSKVKVDPKTKQQTGGHPMVTLTFHVNEPVRFAGQKVMLYFTLNATQNQTTQQKYQRFYDTMQDCGMPQEMRGKRMAEIAKWALSENRQFEYEVKPAWNNPAEKEFKPIGVGGPLPSMEDLEKMSQNTFTPGEAVRVAGNDAKVLEVLPNNKIKVEFPNGQTMEIDAAMATK